MQSEADANDTSINKEDEGTSVTMVDVLKEQEAFEEDAKAVLGASDDKNCTYNSGYVKRQALYACITCCPDSVAQPSTRAGMCLACSLVCHENHDLVELYTKRNFRCDCGSPKFPNNPCNFAGIKSEPNIHNSYNQNFAGLYCVCHRPYPDPESNDDDEMIQCIICEDWLHSKHLNSKVPLSDQYSEMICQACMTSNDFLNNYMCYNVKAEERENESSMSVEVNDLDKSLAEKTLTDVSLDQIDDSLLNKTDTSACLNTDESITRIELNKQEINSKHSQLTDSSNNSDINVSKIPTTEECNKITVDTIPDESPHINSIEKSSEIPLADVDESSGMEVQPTEINSLTSETHVEGIGNKSVEMVPSNEIKIDTPLEHGKPPTDDPDSVTIIPKDIKIDTVNTIEAEISSLEKIDAPIEKILGEEKNASIDIVPEDNEIKCGDSTNIDKLVTEDVFPSVTAGNFEESINETNEKSELPKNEQPTQELCDSVKLIEPSTDTRSNETDRIPEIPNCITDKPTVINELDIPHNSSVVKESTTMDIDVDVNLMENSTDRGKSISPVIKMQENNQILENHLNMVTSIDNNISGRLATEVTESLDLSTALPVPEIESGPNSEKKELAEEASNCEVDVSCGSIATKLDTPTMEVDSIENISAKLGIQSTKHSSDAAADVDNIKNVDQNNLENNAVKTPPTLANGETNGEKNAYESKKRKLDDETMSDGEVFKKKKINSAEAVCVKPSDDERVEHHGAVFWPSDWRRKLCPCSRCVATYDEKKVSFLLDTEDTVTAYEDLGKIKNSGSSQYEKGLEALSSLGHVQQINAITEYNKMKEKLNEFLTTFKNTNKVVKEEDIKSFFAGMKPKREPDGVYFCH